MTTHREYIDKVVDYMEYLMGGVDGINSLVTGFPEEIVAYNIMNISLAAYPSHRMAAIGVIGSMMFAIKTSRKAVN